jgi:AraC family transcriptional regulator
VPILKHLVQIESCSDAKELPLRDNIGGVVSFERAPQRYSAVAAQLAVAAPHARAGDAESARSHIASALTLLENQAPAPPAGAGITRRKAGRALRGAFAPWQARRVAVYIDAHLGGPIWVKDLAALLKFSTSHFCRAFRRTFGSSARSWIGLRRVEFAQSLMLSTRAPLSEIALSCGMSDQSHFTRAFRRIVGETPHLWRQARRGAIEEGITDLACGGANPAQRPPPERGSP